MAIIQKFVLFLFVGYEWASVFGVAIARSRESKGSVKAAGIKVAERGTFDVVLRSGR